MEKNSYEHCIYESVDDKSLSEAVSQYMTEIGIRHQWVNGTDWLKLREVGKCLY